MRGKIIGLGLIVLVVAGLWTAGWYYASGELRTQLAALADNDGETAPRLTCAELTIGGFPFRFDLACTGAELVSGDHTATLAGLKASVLAYNPTQALVSAASPLGFANAFTGSRGRVDFDSFEASLRLTARDLADALGGRGWRIARASAVADGVAWYDTITTDLLQASADHVEAHLVDQPEAHDPEAGTAALAGFARVDALTAPGLDISAGAGTLDAILSGLPDDLRVLLEDPDPVRNWQARGGKLTVVKLTGAQAEPEQVVEASGEVSLTERGLIDARLDYRTKGVFERFAGLLEPWQLALLQGRPTEDGTFVNSFGLDDGRLRLLTFTLLEFPPLF